MLPNNDLLTDPNLSPNSLATSSSSSSLESKPDTDELSFTSNSNNSSPKTKQFKYSTLKDWLEESQIEKVLKTLSNIQTVLNKNMGLSTKEIEKKKKQNSESWSDFNKFKEIFSLFQASLVEFLDAIKGYNIQYENNNIQLAKKIIIVSKKNDLLEYKLLDKSGTLIQGDLLISKIKERMGQLNIPYYHYNDIDGSNLTYLKAFFPAIFDLIKEKETNLDNTIKTLIVDDIINACQKGEGEIKIRLTDNTDEIKFKLDSYNEEIVKLDREEIEVNVANKATMTIKPNEDRNKVKILFSNGPVVEVDNKDNKISSKLDDNSRIQISLYVNNKYFTLNNTTLQNLIQSFNGLWSSFQKMLKHQRFASDFNAVSDSLLLLYKFVTTQAGDLSGSFNIGLVMAKQFLEKESKLNAQHQSAMDELTASYKTELDQFEQDLNQALLSLATKDETISQNQIQIEKLTTAHRVAIDEIDQKDNDITQLKAEIESLKTELQVTIESVSDLHNKLVQSEKCIETNHLEHMISLEDYQRKVKSLDTQLVEAKKLNREAADQVSSMTKEIEDAQAKITLFETQLKQLASQENLQSASQNIEAAQTEDLRSLILSKYLSLTEAEVQAAQDKINSFGTHAKLIKEEERRIKTAYQALIKFKKAIKRVEEAEKPALAKSLVNLYSQIVNEVKSNPHIQIADKNSTYAITIQHFTQLAKKMSKQNHRPIPAKLQKSCELLEKKLNGKPMSKLLKAAICGVIGAMVGVSLGITIGGMATAWAGGFGALPAALMGASLGVQIGAGVALGTAVTLPIITGCVAGFFHARHQQALASNRKQMPLSKEVDEKRKAAFISFTQSG